MTVNLERIISNSLELASLPEVVMRAIDLINDPDTSAADMGHVIAEDPALTARLLRIVNSPFYGFPSHIETISRAVTVIGTMELLDLVLATSVVKAFAGVPDELTNMDTFWEHSLYTGVVARVIAGRIRAPSTERYFVAGLLHDIGSLVLYRQLPKLSGQVLSKAHEQSLVLDKVEREIIGLDHCEAGAALLKAWNLPKTLIESTRLHHRPMEATEFLLETVVVHIADVIACALNSPISDKGRVPTLSPESWEALALPEDSINSIAQEADQLFAEARSIILPSASVA